MPNQPESPPSNLTLDPKVKASIAVLVVDDEHTFRESCATLLSSGGYSVEVCGRGEEALELLGRRPFDIVLADVFMSGVSGMEILETALKVNPSSIVIMMTGNPSVESSVQALRLGAWDYVPKPFSATHLQIMMGRAAHTVVVGRESQTQIAAKPKDEKGTVVSENHSRSGVLLGASPAFAQVISLVHQVSKTDASVFVTGESGTGKEMIAQLIHQESRRASRELVAVNCAALPETLLESEMFGHVEGAFTGAVREKTGLLEVANGGTLFLDELTEMPMSIQAKLLRVIQDGVLRKLGSTQTDSVVNVRFIAATNMDAAEAVEMGKLRKDLFYRLRVVPIHIPPLRERPEDIPVLAEHFLATFWAQHRGDEPAPTFTGSALEALVDNPWQGNVRELRNVLEHAVVMLAPGSDISPENLPFIDDSAASPPAAGFPDGFSFHGDYHEARERVLAAFERGYLARIVRRAKGNMSDAARIAGVDRTTLYRLMQKHGLDRQDLLSRTEG
ncbi:MAG: sigma-54-dependent transcriptional regulator [Longimicrobiales bacterium]